jgi:uncharacterized protein YndB with AHSA1/START domain
MRATDETEEIMSTSATLPHSLDRTLLIRARPETVFRFFTDTSRWASWWGAGSTIDARPGGAMTIRFPDGSEARGEVLDVRPPRRLAFSYGYASGRLIAPGASQVIITLDAEGPHTRLHLHHEFADAAVRDEHVQGWRYQLSLFANAVANDVHAGADQTVDAWFASWSEPDASTRDATLVRTAAPDVQFRDRFSAIAGREEVSTHMAAAQRFMPGITLRRDGEIRHCQGTVLSEWIASAADGQERARGTNVFILNGDGQIESVIGFWGQHPGR